jgi:uncharacterized protein
MVEYRTTPRTRTWFSAVLVAVGAPLLPACVVSSEREAAKRGEPVEFEASDGVRLTGTPFGEGRVGVVLAHMGRPGDTQADFRSLARALAERGYLALTYNRRGVCGAPNRECSGGFDDGASSWKDVVGAAAFVRSQGGTRVVLIGASIGAMASLEAATSRRVDPTALVEIGGVNYSGGYDFARAELQALDGAKLFVSSADDMYGAAEAAREWHGWASEPKQLAILPGGEHGTDMLLPGQPTATLLVRLVLRFLTRTVPPDGGGRT